MIVIPAVDIRQGKVVRLVEGLPDSETTFGDDPAEWARRWVSEGAEYLHIVDLDGAFEGEPKNLECVKEIIETAGVPIEFGGGVRETPLVQTLADAGADRIIIGSAVIDDRPWADLIFEAFPLRIAVGIDAREGRVAIHGWTEVTDIDALELARECEAAGAAALIYTDISRDGKMEGTNIDAMRAVVETIEIPIIASGGVTTIDDILALAATGCDGCIIGRALYEGRISLPEALQAAESVSGQ